MKLITFQSLLPRYQIGLETSMKGKDFVFDSIDGMYCKYNMISLNRGDWCIDSGDWIKSKKGTINPKNNGDKCFQYTLTVKVNHE